MRKRLSNFKRSILLLCLLFMALSSCTNPFKPPNDENHIWENSQPEQKGDEPVEDPLASPAPTLTETPAITPLRLFISNAVPNEAIDRDQLDDIAIRDDPTAELWFGLENNAPEGEVLGTSTIVYALTAPFPTLTDDISTDALKAYWLGNPEGAMETIPQIYVPKLLASELEEKWGKPDPIRISSYQQPPDTDLIWETHNWAIIPFDQLNSRLKVVSLDGISPLFSEFEEDDYLLSVTFLLKLNQKAADRVTDSVISSVINSITPSNRDPEKMTTLVMTGVTALVRAIAYRMELYGPLYPAENIRDWLINADLTHISNEVSFYEDCPFPDPSSPRLLFCSNPRYIELLEYVGADIIEVTGNHNNDAMYMYGVDAANYSFDLYEERGMGYFGGGRNLADAKSPLFMTHNGNQFAFIGCNAFGPDHAWATEDQPGSAPCEDMQWMANEISQLKQDGYLPIATFQYYEDYYDWANAWHVRDFGLMAEAGALIVNGSQAHRPKGMDFKEDAFIHYGLGNLFFDQNWVIDMYDNVIVQTSWEIIQRHTFYDNQHLSVELLTAKLENYSQPRPMTQEEREEFLTQLFDASGWDWR